MAEVEKEITVKLKWSLDEAKVYFVNTGGTLTESYVLRDIYMIKDNVDINKISNLEVLSNAVIIREVAGQEHTFKLVYKNKKYDDEGNIISSTKYNCALSNADDAYELLKAIGFKECFRYEQECLEYNIDDKNILLEYIHELGLFAEIEGNNKSVEELIADLNYMNIPYYEGNYFVKKASLMLDTMKKKKR